MNEANGACSAELAAWVVDARDRTLELVADLTDEQMLGPHLPIVNPLWWEIGHVAWFQEHWVLRRSDRRPSLRVQADALYDSAQVPHDDRWTLPLPSRAETVDYLQRVRDQVLKELQAGEITDEDLYFNRLAVFHEDMHTEAFTYTRQTLACPVPRLSGIRSAGSQGDGAGPLPGDALVPGGTLMLGATPDLPFVFDNEKWAHPVEVQPFRIARAA